MADAKKTICTIFLVPPIQIDREKLKENNFLNAYSSDKMHEEVYEDAVHLLFKPNNIDRFREFLDAEYERTTMIITDYDYLPNFVVVVYKLDPKFKTDFDKIREGLYSKTSPEFQALFPKVVKITVNGLSRDEISLQVRIFKKTEDLRKFWEEKFDVDLMEHIEVWDGYHEENETLTQDKLNAYLEKKEVLV